MSSYIYYHNIFIIGLGFTGFFLIMCTLLFFLFNMRKVFGEILGYSKKQALKRQHPLDSKLLPSTGKKHPAVIIKDREISVEQPSGMDYFQYQEHPVTEIIEDRKKSPQNRGTEILEEKRMSLTEELDENVTPVMETVILSYEEEELGFVGTNDTVDF